ncbi:hypothetical protein EYC80_007857 [Monilinia laxa]|uniref:Uncharacterized protein n=1 Tax=Monilinia laxa TaxID=61186 RepID=A0A5N6JSR0_MONLA|nr:hypothetical protein EYC80_007857 [Monilinia laxa]
MIEYLFQKDSEDVASESPYDGTLDIKVAQKFGTGWKDKRGKKRDLHVHSGNTRVVHSRVLVMQAQALINK